MNKFKKTVQSIPEIMSFYRDDLDALRGSDKSRIQNPEDVKINGSLYLDEALSVGSHSNSNRWDYGIGIVGGRKREEVIWVEVHSGDVSETDVVLRKLAWLRTWLNESGLAFSEFNQRFFWVTHGQAPFIATSKEAKLLAMNNLKNVGGALKLRHWK